MHHFPDSDAALLALQQRLGQLGYRFVTTTPASHARVLRRGGRQEAATLADVFGWSLPFAPGVLADDLRALLRAGGALDEDGPLDRSRVRVSSLGGRNYLHSAYPTTAGDAVFLGPDSYRFADVIAAELAARPPPAGARIVDIGTGAGVGAMTAAALCPTAAVTATDPNESALRLARINAAHAGLTMAFARTSGLAGVAGDFDVALLNPPYIVDGDGRAYRHGGGMHGAELSLELATEALGRLAPGGRAILYTGSAILDGRDPLREALEQAAERHRCAFRYREIDPDIFGEELDEPAYADVDRIAAVEAILTRAG